ncbi:MAG: ATP-binding cassette domain-containing protein [Cyanobacteriota bacterium]|nr:ATP-binding cassette domain-containing protein [Cyanobacteriota bacterium]
MQVDLQNIDKWFGAVHANQQVTLRVAAGAIHGLLGENGAGKSTLVKILSGFVRRDGGQILLNQRAVDIRSPAQAIRLGIGMLHQDPLDFPSLTVLENFLAGQPGSLFLNYQQSAQRLVDWAREFHFELPPQQRVADLTVGERQQLELIRLLSLGVQTLILDEPTTGITASQKTLLFEALRRLAHQGKSVIFVSHKLEDVEQLCHRVTVMRQGSVVGELGIPTASATLIDLMFGRALPPPLKPPTRQPIPLLCLKNTVLQNSQSPLPIPDFTLQQGEVIGLAGVEGSGQQRLLLHLAGLSPAVSGSLYVGDLDLSQQPYLAFGRAGIVYSPADRLQEGLIRGLSIHEHFLLKDPQRGWRIRWQATLATTQAALAHFKIRGQVHSRVEHLSGGNQQRTQLALLPDSWRLLVMEHPTRGLDIESAQWIWQQLIERCRQGSAIIFASSDLDEIMQYSDRVMVFSGGQVSPPLPVESLTVNRLGELIGGKFEEPAILEKDAV